MTYANNMIINTKSAAEVVTIGKDARASGFVPTIKAIDGIYGRFYEVTFVKAR
jgi:hypothetical protein